MIFGGWNLTARLSRITTLMLVVAIYAAAGLAQTAPAAKAQRRFAAAVDKTVAEGRDAILPPHISNLLGISPEEREVPVKQFAEVGEVVKGFDVSAAKHDDIVIFVEHPADKGGVFYLASRSGKVRKVVEVDKGVGYGRVPTAKDRTAFESEKQHWVDRLGKR